MGSSRSQTAEFRARCGFCYQAKFSWGEESNVETPAGGYVNPSRLPSLSVEKSKPFSPVAIGRLFAFDLPEDVHRPNNPSRFSSLLMCSK